MLSVDEQMRVIMRGVTYTDPDLDTLMRKQLRERLEQKGRLKVYLGVDPTTPELHLGHTVPLCKLRQFQDLGHEVVFLIGDFTGMIGDPSGQSATRPERTREQVLASAKTYTDQAFRIIDRDKTQVVYNSEWLSTLTLDKVVRLAAKLTLARVMSHEDFRQRYTAGVPISLHELLYCIMQGYDALVLDVDVQVGGTDQLFNMLVGRVLQEAFGNVPHIPVTLPILLGTDGKRKMSKTYGNAINLSDAPADMYGKVMSLPDSLVGMYFELLTEVPVVDIHDMNLLIEKGQMNPRDGKMRLAREIAGRFHGSDAAVAAEQEFVRVFQKKELPTDMPEVSIPGVGEGQAVPIVEFLVATGMSSSKSEARRLVQQRGVRIDDETVESVEASVTLRNGMLINVGKRKFVKLII